MKTTFISKEGNNVKFTMDFTAEEFNNAVVAAYKKNKDQFSIDGFRKGKAPRSIIETHYGQDVFFEDAVNDMLGTGYPKAVGELELNVIDSPKIEMSEIKKDTDITVTVTVAVIPEIEAKDYFGVEVENVKNTISDEDVEKELKDAQKKQARMETVDREAKDGDTVIIDFEGTVDGVKFEGGTAENHELKLGSGQFIPGFEEQLVGKKAEEEVDVVVTFPEEYQAADLAGKEAHFKTTIHEVKEEVLPEINDDFAGDISEFETLDEYKKDLAKKLQIEANENAESIMKDHMLEAVYNNNKFDIPAVMIEDEIETMLKETEQQLSSQGLNLQTYMQYLNKTMDDLKAEVRPDAEKRVGMRLLLSAVVRQEKIKAAEEDIEKELKDMADQYGQDVDSLKKMLGEDNLKFFTKDVEVKKAIETLYDNIKIVEPKEEPKEETK